MAYPELIKKKAFAMYLQKIELPMIAELLDIKSPKTIDSWVSREKWSQCRNETFNAVLKIEGIAGRKYKMVADKIIDLHEEAIKKKKDLMLLKITNRDAIEAVKLARLLEGESTENVAMAVKDVTDSDLDDAYEDFKQKFAEQVKQDKRNVNNS